MTYVYWCPSCDRRVEVEEPEPPEVVRCGVEGIVMRRDYQAEAANISREGFR